MISIMISRSYDLVTGPLPAYSGRLGGRREDEMDHAELERVWRNGKLNGVPFRYMREWSPPFDGILELDFVEITKPDPNGDVKDAGCVPLRASHARWREYQRRAVSKNILSPRRPNREFLTAAPNRNMV